MTLAPLASATHVDPEFVPGPDNHTCSDFAAEGEVLLELKVDPPVDGVYTSADGELTVTLDVDAQTKVFAWSSNLAVVGVVFVKAGSAGHHLYEYDPPSDADAGLTTPGDGDSNQISHISFCYMLDQEPTCEDHPEMPECQPTCDDQPDMPECQETPCPATLLAAANADGSITLTITADGASQLFRKEAGGPYELLGSFTGDAEHIDTTVTAGLAYTYKLVVAGEECGLVEVSAIPDFPTVVGAVAATGLGIAGYAFMRRKK